MRNSSVCYVVSLLLIATFPRAVSASWLSDISGVDINVPKNTITLGAPRPDRIPMMLQNLPKDLAIYLLNPLAGGALAYAIREAKESARKVCVPVPGNIRMILAPFFPPELFQGVCWAVVGSGQSLDTWAIRDRGMAAITLEDVIIFRNNDAGNSDAILWAHELTHVLQYRSLGVEGFAALYVVAFDALEQQARDFDQFVTRMLQPQNMNPAQTGIPQYWTATNDWKTSKPIAVQQYVSYARQAVEPLKCTTVRNTMHQIPYPLAYVDIVNSCPIAIRVSSFHVRNLADGSVQSAACASIFSDCTIGPGKVGSWAVAGIRRTDTGGNFNVTADIAW
jgi:hypothetical protein